MSAQGLTEAEAARRLALYGGNVVPSHRRRPIVVEYLLRFRNPLILLLVAASIAAGWSGDATSTGIIIAIVVASVTLDFVQEYRASRAVERLQSTIAAQASVLRDGVRRVVAVAALVPGDVVFVTAGDIVPADGRLVEAERLQVNESLLTGESFPVDKQVEAGPTGEIRMGTSIASGTGAFAVDATGSRTELASLSMELAAARPEAPFERGIRQFGMMILRLTMMLVLVVLLASALQGRAWLESLLFAVALAVGLTPELLPMITSLALAHGALRLATKHVIVKRTPAIYALGSVDVLCTDKTGTLTEARIGVAGAQDSQGAPDDSVIALAAINSALVSGVRSPLDDALHEHAAAADRYRKLDESPFGFTRRYASVLVANLDDGRRLLIAKGAPEDVLARCTRERPRGAREPVALSDGQRSAILERFASLGERGFRVLAVAIRDLPQDCERIAGVDEGELAFVGFVMFFDPPRRDAAAALTALRHSGIAIKILTGDDERVSRHVCAALQLPVESALRGKQIDAMDDEALASAASTATLFCRVTPAQKTRVIAALRARGHTVGFMGDGINDAPALRAADVGISVQGAAGVAREAADVILTRSHLMVVHEGVLEGRRTYANIMKYLMMVTSSSFGNMLSMAGAAMFLPFLPMLPVQILLNNLLYDLSETAIPFDRVEASELRRPHAFDVHEIRRFMLVLGPASSLFDVLTFAILLSLGATGALFQTGWFIESIATQVLVIFVIRTRRNPLRARPHPMLALTSMGVVATAIALPYTPAGAWFGLVAPPLFFLPIVAGLCAGYLAMAELAKHHVYRAHTAWHERHHRSRVRRLPLPKS